MTRIGPTSSLIKLRMHHPVDPAWNPFRTARSWGPGKSRISTKEKQGGRLEKKSPPSHLDEFGFSPKGEKKRKEKKKEKITK